MNILHAKQRLLKAHDQFLRATNPVDMAESRSELNDARACYAHVCVMFVEDAFICEDFDTFLEIRNKYGAI